MSRDRVSRIFLVVTESDWSVAKFRIWDPSPKIAYSISISSYIFTTHEYFFTHNDFACALLHTIGAYFQVLIVKEVCCL